MSTLVEIAQKVLSPLDAPASYLRSEIIGPDELDDDSDVDEWVALDAGVARRMAAAGQPVVLRVTADEIDAALATEVVVNGVGDARLVKRALDAGAKLRAVLVGGETGIDAYRAAAAARLELGTRVPIRVRWDGVLDVKGAALALTFGADELAGPLAPRVERLKLAQIGGPPEDAHLPQPRLRRVADPRRRTVAGETMTIRDKIEAGERLDFDDGVGLFHEPDLMTLGAWANRARERRHGDRTYFNVNMHLNATNVCIADCKFCSFARLEEGMPGAYTMTIEDAVDKVTSRPADLTEVHIVNGLHGQLPFSYYEELLRAIKQVRPLVHLKAFTAVEIWYFAEHFQMTVEEVLRRLIDAGLGSLPGGGAEVFADRVRRKICADKVDADGWIDVHRIAHRLGLRSNCTMLYGHIETVEERVDHLLKLRSLQDETGGFQTFIPLAFHNENNALQNLPGPTGVDDLRLFAVSRLLLDNISHVKAYWAMLGVKAAQIAQWWGADDLDGTVEEEKIYKMAGSRAPDALTRAELVRLIRAAGRVPVERDTLYHVVRDDFQIERKRGRLEVVA